MKWGIAILLILGVVAAACAALLMGSLKIGSSASTESQPESVEVAMAKVSLPAATVVTLELINEDIVSRDELPEGNPLTPLQIIGRVLAVPVVEGQVLTESCFVAEGIGALLAAQIPHGMRAVTVAVSSRAMPDRILLYPGAVVDVLVCYTISSSEGESLSQTMLRGIKVLAVSGDSVISKPVQDENKKRNSRGTIVTLMVDPKQAEALQLAVENGSLTMSLRNPLDRKTFVLEGSVLNRGSLLRKGDTLPPTISNEQDLPEGQWFDGGNLQEQRITPDNPPQEKSKDSVFSTKMPVLQPKSINNYQNRKNSRWEVEVIRGPVKKVEDFDAPEDKADENTPKK